MAVGVSLSLVVCVCFKRSGAVAVCPKVRESRFVCLTKRHKHKQEHMRVRMRLAPQECCVSESDGLIF